MTGLLLFRATQTKYPQHVHVRMSFTGGHNQNFATGTLDVSDVFPCSIKQASITIVLAVSGWMPSRCRAMKFVSLMEGRRGRLKPLLMHQQVIAGIGNIYANEMLFRAGLHPNREANRLRRATIETLYEVMQTVLRDAISCGGSSVKDFFAPDGTEGQYKHRHLVYGKEGQPCPNRCGRIIRRLQSERSSFFCPPARRAKRHVDFLCGWLSRSYAVGS